MPKIVNEPRIRFALIRKVREQLEHRAMWLALLTEEVEKKGLPPEEYAAEAIYRCGQIQGKGLTDRTTSFKRLKKNLFTRGARWVFEMKILECTDDKLSIDFHYCPLVKAWQKMGLPDEKIAKLCDTAMCGDRGIASCFGGRLDLPEVIAKGDPVCKIRFVKEEKEP